MICHMKRELLATPRMVVSLKWHKNYSLQTKFSGYSKNFLYYDKTVYSKSVKMTKIRNQQTPSFYVFQTLCRHPYNTVSDKKQIYFA